MTNKETMDVQEIARIIEVAEEYAKGWPARARKDARAHADKAIRLGVAWYTSPESGSGWTSAEVLSTTFRRVPALRPGLVAWRIAAQVRFA